MIRQRLVEYERRVLKVFATNISVSSGNKRNSVLLVCCGQEEDRVQWVSEKLLWIIMGVRVSTESQAYGLLKYKLVIRPIDTLDETFECDCVRWSTDDDVNYRLR